MTNTRNQYTLIAAVTLALVVGACGVGSTTDTAPPIAAIEGSSTTEGADNSLEPTSNTPVDLEAAMLEYTECMREHGIEFPDLASGSPVVVESNLDPTVYSDATEACDPLLQGQFDDFTPDPAAEAERLDQELKFSACMRDNGVSNWPDPVPDAGVVVSDFVPNVEPAAVDAAIAICADELPQESGGLIVSGG